MGQEVHQPFSGNFILILQVKSSVLSLDIGRIFTNMTILDWVIFLKYIDDFEKDKTTAAELTGAHYKPIIDTKYQWGVWASPKGKDGKLDHRKALGEVGSISKMFIEFQQHLYQKQIV